MNTALLLSGVLLLFVSALFVVVALFRDVFQKEMKNARRIYLGSLAAGILAFLLSFALDDLTSALTVVAFLGFLAVVVLLVAAFIRKCFLHKKNAKLWIALAAVLAVSVGSYKASGAVYQRQLQNHEAFEVEIVAEADFEVRDGDTPITVVTSRGFDSSLATAYRQVFDEQDLPLLLEENDVTAQDCIALIRESGALDENYKEYLVDFVLRIEEKYPDANLAILFHNLKTLRIVVLDRMSYLNKSLSVDSYGCYHKPDNTIYIPEGTVYVEGEWGFQVLLHEFCHACRTSWFDADGKQNRLQFCSAYNNLLLEESMNSVFSCSLLNYEEKDIAYQVPSNYLRIMLSCMDNYTLSDYMNHSEEYFLKKLDEFTGHTNYAQVIWKLITLQRSDWADDTMDIPPENYRAIYAYLADMYYDKHLTPEMTEREKLTVADALAEKAFFDAPDNYKIEPEFFRNYLEVYNRRTAPGRG